MHKLALITLFALSSPAILLADEPQAPLTPVKIAAQLIIDITKTQSLEPAIDKIDWKGAYKKMDPAEKEQMEINNVDDFKSREIERFQGMGGKVSESIAQSLAKSPQAKGSMLSVMKERLSTSLEEQKAAAMKSYAETKYSIGRSTIKEDRAEVELIKKRGDQSISDTLEFVKHGEEWKLVSAAPFNPTSSAGKNNQLKSILGPSIASPNEAVLRLH